MRFTTAAHRFGDLVVPADIQRDIADAIRQANTVPTRRTSYQIKDEILQSLQEAGWSAEVVLHPSSRITITSCKMKVGLVFQTGNMARMYADLLKLQTLYLRDTIIAAVFIVPTRETARLLGENITNLSRLENELSIFERAITVPIMIYGFA
jgi:hypothetical protein